jgi:hypothetical protein
METPQGLRCHLCECRDYAASHPVPLPSNPDMLRDLASIGVPGAAEKLANKNDVPTLAAVCSTSFSYVYRKPESPGNDRNAAS